MSANSTSNIARVAVLVGKPGDPLPVSTIRRWTRQYSQFMSADANPASGIERRYDARDVAVLRRIHELRNERMTESDIVAALSASPPIAVEVVPADEPTETHDDVVPVQPVQESPGTTIAPLVVLDDLVTRVGRLEHDAPAQQRRMLVLVAVAVGVALAVGVVLGAIVVAMVR